MLVPASNPVLNINSAVTTGGVTTGGGVGLLLLFLHAVKQIVTVKKKMIEAILFMGWLLLFFY
jgi:hypothetical protein